MLLKAVKTVTKKDGEKGLTASANINKDEVVWILNKGEEVLSKEQRDDLPESVKKLAFQYGENYIVVHDGSEAMNHSCDPNLWWEGNDTLTARRDIKKGEELTYDYSSADVGDWIAGWKCKCGSEICRSKITGRDCLDKDFQKRFEGHLPTWVERFIRNN